VLTLVRSTGKLSRLVIYGSYVTDKPEPRDIDIVLVLQDDFLVEACDPEQRLVFDHERAEKELGTSMFWIRPALILFQTVDEFISGWQLERDGSRRGIVEVLLRFPTTRR
jgi:hypothetical protein